MIKKAIILAGGTGSRLNPITLAVNKHLLPVNDKPLIFYPLSVLMLAGIREILIIVNQGNIPLFRKLLGNGSQIGLKITYVEQKKPSGIPDAFNLGKKFIANDNVALILGDNFFYGQSFTEKFKSAIKLNKGAKIFLYPVRNPTNFGVANMKNKKIITLEEKPKKPKSNLVITGFYLFDNSVVSKIKNLKFSKEENMKL